MPEGYRHLTFDGRCRIYATGKGGLSDGAIAGRPGRHPATISREIRRDGGGRGYRQGQARRNALRAPAAAGKETGPAGWPPRGPGSHPGAPERGRGEGGDRRPGSGHGDRRGTRRCGGVACGQMPGIHACPTG